MKTSEREQNLIDAAREVYGDYLSYGVVLQQDENGGYGEQSPVGMLAAALKAYDKPQVIDCDNCRKCGTNICGNDPTFRCFEPKTGG